jgi:glycosyltransferase involved in cell wall biosynthesis
MDLKKKGADKTHLIEICANLKLLGNEILLIAPGYYPYKEIKIGFLTYYVKLGNKSYFSYLIYHIKLIYLFVLMIKRFKPDVVYSRDILIGFILYRIAKTKKIPYIIEKNSIIPDELSSRGFNKFFIKGNEILERLNAKNCDGIVAVTKGIKEELIKRYKIYKGKIAVIINGANHVLFIPMDKNYVRKQLGLENDTFIVGFSGSFAPWQNLDVLIDAANVIKKKGCNYNIKYLLVGDGEMKSKILKLITYYKLSSDFILPGRVEYEQVPKYINASDVVIVLKSKLSGAKLFSPLKFFEYAFCGVPIIFSNNIIGEEIKEFKNKLGYEIHEDNSQELADAILRAYTNINKLREDINKIRNDLIKKYSWLNSAKQLEKYLNSKLCEKNINNKKLAI